MGSSGFQRAARLLTKADFSYVFADPEKFADRYFTVLVRQNPHSGSARLGLAVSKKVSKSAVVRNAIKRRVRESFRQHRSRLDRCDIVVIARQPAACRARGQPGGGALSDALLKHWERVSRLCAPD